EAAPAKGADRTDRRDGTDRPDGTAGKDGGRVLSLDAAEWKSCRERWERKLGVSPHALPLRALGRLEETAGGVSGSAGVAESAEALTMASVVWDKQPFDAWWESAGRTLGTAIEAPTGEYAIRAPAAEGCTVDTWVGILHGIEPRHNHTAVWTGAEMIIWGG